MQLQVDRSYGSRVVEAVMENSADFGLTQLPVEEKRLQVVDIYRDEIRLIVPGAAIRWPNKNRLRRRTWWTLSCCSPSRARRARG